MANGQSTRIPVSRSRAGSVSQGLYSGNPSRIADDGTRRNGDANPSSHYAEQSELWPVEEGSQSQRSRSTVRLPRHKGSDILSESAPFAAGGATWAPLDGGRRTSNDSDERPFEHWYRGDYARNGGVGELRVGRREEMLDIANYGHVHRKPSSRAALSNYSRSRSTSRGRETARMRQRAESVSAPAHDSFYMEEEEADMVLDERPPTDVDESDVEQEYANEVEPHPNGTVSSPSLLNSSQAASRDVSQQRIQQSIPPTVSRIPTPTSSRKMSPPPRTPTPTKAMRASTETRASSTAPSTPQRLPRSQTQPQLQSASKQKNAPAAKRKAKSPAPQTSASKTKKAKTKPPSAMRNVVPRKEDDRRSIGQYPTPDGDNVVDAIPTWTQPVPPSGNWDDVVLPVVARKKGLESHYTPADGSPKPKQKRGSDVYEPVSAATTCVTSNYLVHIMFMHDLIHCGNINAGSRHVWLRPLEKQAKPDRWRYYCRYYRRRYPNG
ncbi:hypothetical protein WOLCODRAFT_67522 [Wolfiporia cocos MD-104 SS10]|uniref:Uncharacterized protein n=1 Tax=Wolfiporia cocos (strain MD-104) TaxID=742152 RepID=A0A2H3JNQ6_WOLCO|nr:hypothetical protein WOLCODRAFT_67522 [Wolfiporia cocos MD-104 SS10]